MVSLTIIDVRVPVSHGCLWMLIYYPPPERRGWAQAVSVRPWTLFLFQRRESAEGRLPTVPDWRPQWVGAVVLRVPPAPAAADQQVKRCVCETLQLVLLPLAALQRTAFLIYCLLLKKIWKCRKKNSYDFLTTFIMSAIHTSPSHTHLLRFRFLFSPVMCFNLWRQ